jgi:pimeloyl-ACP methyl ester carboxylesterase
LFFHGFPGSLIQASVVVPHLSARNLFLIAANRPGYGETTGTGTAAEFLDELGALTRSLAASPLHVIGVSGGAPWAHMMASRFFDAIVSLSIVCGLAPYNRETARYFTPFQNRALKLRRWLPDRLGHGVLQRLQKNVTAEQKIAVYKKFLHPIDAAALEDVRFHKMLVNSLEAAFRQGPKGILFDSKVYARDWLHRECDLERLREIPTAYYHGNNDLLLNAGMSEWMRRQNPNARLILENEEGHYSLALNHIARVLSDLPMEPA